MLARSKRPSLRETPMATMPMSGRPTALTIMPAMATPRSCPAAAPRMSGKMRLPAPKNRPNSMDASVTSSGAVKRVFIRYSSRGVV